tara:strand:+ start:4219 stop:4614 length:396 start_codon:yes stop_codon:yes gene_type:complete
MKLVRNSFKYWEFIRNLRNNEEVKEGFVQQSHITKFQHLKFMFKHGKDYYICLNKRNTKPLGFVGQINGDIRVAVAPEHQGKGIGKFMINELMKKHPQSFAKVKIENSSSLWLFKKCGFKEKYYILERDAS